MKCCRCKEPAIYDHPAAFCNEHWARWWAGYDKELDPVDPSETNEVIKKGMYEYAIKNLKKEK